MTKLLFPIICCLILLACNSTKKNSTAKSTPAPEIIATPAPTVQTNTVSAVAIGPFMKPMGYMDNFEPANNDLPAIHEKYKDVSIETLKQGHSLYIGVCANCHKAKSIYTRSEQNWLNIINDMAIRANITDSEKDALYKYVLAAKATQPK